MAGLRTESHVAIRDSLSVKEEGFFPFFAGLAATYSPVS